MGGGGSGSAPKNIIGNGLSNSSHNNNSNNNNSGGNHPNSFGAGDSLFFQSQLISPNLGDTLASISPDLRMTATDHHLHASIRDELAQQQQQQQHSNGLFDNNGSGGLVGFSKSPGCLSAGAGGLISELDRLKEELMGKSAQLLHMEELRNKVYEKWKTDAEKVALVEQQRDEALNHAQVLKEKIDMYAVQNGPNLINGQELRSLSLPKLKALQVG